MNTSALYFNGIKTLKMSYPIRRKNRYLGVLEVKTANNASKPGGQIPLLGHGGHVPNQQRISAKE
jgi:hypothetical protein